MFLLWQGRKYRRKRSIGRKRNSRSHVLSNTLSVAPEDHGAVSSGWRGACTEWWLIISGESLRKLYPWDSKVLARHPRTDLRQDSRLKTQIPQPMKKEERMVLWPKVEEYTGFIPPSLAFPFVYSASTCHMCKEVLPQLHSGPTTRLYLQSSSSSLSSGLCILLSSLPPRKKSVWSFSWDHLWQH